MYGSESSSLMNSTLVVAEWIWSTMVDSASGDQTSPGASTSSPDGSSPAQSRSKVRSIAETCTG